MALAVEDIEATIRAYVSAEIECEALPSDPSRIGCVMPLQYPSGGFVTVWIEQLGNRFRVSDFGESFLGVIGRKRSDVRAMESAAGTIVARWGVKVVGGALVVQAPPSELGDAVWRVAAAAHRVAETALVFRPQRQERHREDYFVREVEGVLRQRKLSGERDAHLPGQSGYTYKATLYVPALHTIVEPIHANAHYNQISSVYLKFGDLSHANGYTRLALVDDRSASPGADLDGALSQVSTVVRWSRRELWMDRYFAVGEQ